VSLYKIAFVHVDGVRLYVSELRPPTGLVFIPLVIYEYGEPRRNDIDRGETGKIAEKPIPVTFSSPQIAHGLKRARTRASKVRSQRLKE
jgi:hypothetical protein